MNSSRYPRTSNRRVLNCRPQIEHTMYRVVEQLDHHCGDDLVRMKLNLKRPSAQSVNQWNEYNTTLLKDKTKQNEFRIALNNRFQALEKLIEEETVEEK